MTSKENRFMYFLRSLYYKAIRKMSEVDQIEHFTGFGLYDSTFIEVLRNLHDPTPFLNTPGLFEPPVRSLRATLPFRTEPSFR